MTASVQLSFADLGTAAEAAGQRKASPAGELRATRGPTSKRPADRAALAALEAALVEAREAADDRPPLVVLATCLGQLGSPPAPTVVSVASLRQARDDWLRRLETAHKSESALVAYRVAIDDLLDFGAASPHRPRRSDDRRLPERLRATGSIPRQRRTTEGSYSSAAFFAGHQAGRRARPVPRPRATAKTRQERDWLTPDEFRKLLDAAGHPQRNLPGLAERDRLALLALVTTGLRRSELCALEWRDLDLDGRKRSLLVRLRRQVRRNVPRRQPAACATPASRTTQSSPGQRYACRTRPDSILGRTRPRSRSTHAFARSHPLHLLRQEFAFAIRHSTLWPRAAA